MIFKSGKNEKKMTTDVVKVILVATKVAFKKSSRERISIVLSSFEAFAQPASLNVIRKVGFIERNEKHRENF